MGELEFEQCWEFRRNKDNGLDSSCDDSKSSTEPLLKKHKLVSSLISVGDDETSESSRLQQKDNGNPGRWGQIHIQKAKKRKTRDISCKLKNSKLKRVSPEEVDLENGETNAYDPAPLNELKNFMDSLSKDLKVTRENLLKWMMQEMQYLLAGDTTPEPKRRKHSHRGKKVHSQHMKYSKKVQYQREKTHKETVQLQHTNGSDKSIHVQHQTNFQEIVLAQQQSNFQDEENTNRQHQNDSRYGMRAQNCDNRSL